MSELVPEAERLLAVAPEDFVAERTALARRLRDEGRREDAAAVERLRKPSRVVYAVNRAARDRPNAARDAAAAAETVRDLQLRGDRETFRDALEELDGAIALLADVAVAHVAPPGRSATEAMRQRVRDLLRSAVADEQARAALVRGTLTEELEAPGFSPFAGLAAPARSRSASRTRERRRSMRTEAREEERRARVQTLRAELDAAERALADAVDAARAAERARVAAEREVETIRKRLARLE